MRAHVAAMVTSRARRQRYAFTRRGAMLLRAYATVASSERVMLFESALICAQQIARRE